MSSPITFSGFNNIDFGTVLNSLMQAASEPLTALQNRQSDIQSQISTYSTFNSWVQSAQSAAASLADPTTASAFVGTSTDSSAVSISTDAGVTAGHYDVVVTDLARAQVTASASTAPDADTTTVATGGSITIGGVKVNVTGAVTLRQLASAINGTTGIGVNASVVATAPDSYKLVLTGTSTGKTSAFTLTNGLTGGTGVGFTDTNGDGVSGDSSADNAVGATNAKILINNIAAESSTNTFDSVIPGGTLNVFKKDAATTVGIDVAPDSSALKNEVTSFMTAYNNLVTFANAQQKAAGNGDTTSIGHDPLLRQLRSQLRSILTTAHGTGSLTRLPEAGIEFTTSGTLRLNSAMFDAALKSDPAAVQAMFSGTGGAFTAVSDTLSEYSQTSGFVSTAKDALTRQSQSLDTQIANMQSRLATQRASMQQEFTAADTAMSQLKNQSGALSSFGSSLGSL